MTYKILLAVMLTALAESSIMANAPQVHEQHAYKEIHAEQLKTWYDEKIPMTVVDARSPKYFNGSLLPGALRVTSEDSDKTIENAIPIKNGLVVVYCSSIKCPAGGWLADRLVSMGYTNVYKYPEGIHDWVEKGYEITKAEVQK